MINIAIEVNRKVTFFYARCLDNFLNLDAEITKSVEDVSVSFQNLSSVVVDVIIITIVINILVVVVSVVEDY